MRPIHDRQNLVLVPRAVPEIERPPARGVDVQLVLVPIEDVRRPAQYVVRDAHVVCEVPRRRPPPVVVLHLPVDIQLRAPGHAIARVRTFRGAGRGPSARSSEDDTGRINAFHSPW